MTEIKPWRLPAVTLAAGALVSLSLVGCGYNQLDGDAIGQAKKLVHTNNIVCEDYWAFDMSLGVMREGTGSVSTRDIWLTTYDAALAEKLRAFAARGATVRVKYDTRRAAFCTEKFIIKGVEEVRQ